MADCRSLIEFLRAFQHHRKKPSLSPDPRRTPAKSRRSSPSFCSSPSPFALIDAFLLLLCLSSLAFLSLPYLTLILQNTSKILNFLPKPYLLTLTTSLFLSILIYHSISHRIRKCGNPSCKALKKAVEFEIQLETEECVRSAVRTERTERSERRMELSAEQKELETELRKMAPINGRSVLVFRAKCGCLRGRMEVWGARKVRRVKK